MTTITLEKTQIEEKSLSFVDLKELLEFLKDEWHITEYWHLEDELHPDIQEQYDRNLEQRDLFIDITDL